jgi:uncharacterized membrane protein
MPRWPAWIMLGFAAACAYPALTSPPPQDPALERYEARGNEPGWHLLIEKGRIAYSGKGGEKKIAVVRPEPEARLNGRRYESRRLAVDVTHSRCNDDVTGRGFEHQVLVIADGQTLRGCGGERREDWDL